MSATDPKKARKLNAAHGSWLQRIVRRWGCDDALAEMISEAWDKEAPLPKHYPSLVTPSHEQLRSLSEILLVSRGIDASKGPEAVLGCIAVRVSDAVCREEGNLDRLVSPAALIAVGIANQIDRVAVIRLAWDETDRLAIEIYRNLVGIAAVVIDEKVGVGCGLRLSVHFICHETQQAAKPCWHPVLIRFVLGWNNDSVESLIGKEKERALNGGASLNLFQSRLRRFFGGFLKPLLSKFMKPLDPSKGGGKPSCDREQKFSKCRHGDQTPNDPKLSDSGPGARL